MNRVLMKLFKTSHIENIKECRCFSMSNCHLAASATFTEIFVAVVIVDSIYGHFT